MANIPYAHILEQPLVAVAGIVSEAGSQLTLFMHKGYDRLPMPPEAYQKPDLLTPGLWIVGGDRDNPAFSWPVYAVVE